MCSGKRICIIAFILSIHLMLPFSMARAMEDADTSRVVTVYNEKNGLPTGEANAVLQTNDGYIWIGSYGGLIRYDASNFRNYSLEGAIPSSSIRSLYEDTKGRLWIGTNDAGVFLYEHGTFTKIEPEQEHTFMCIRDFAEAKDGTIYVGSNSGLASIRDDTLIPCGDPSFDGETVYSVAVDTHGRVWTAVNSGKCLIVENDTVAYTLSSNEIFEDTDIYCLASDDDGTIYLGTSGNRMARLSFPSSELNVKSFSIELFSTGDVTTHNQISVTDEDNVLVSGLNGFGILSADGKFLEYDETRYASSVNCAITDYEGSIWLASSNYGIIKYTQGCYTTPNLVAGLSDASINAITKSGDCFYLAKDDGLLIYDRNWKPVDNALVHKLANTRIRHLICDSKGRVWLATSTDYGVICYDPGTGDIHSYTTNDGLISDRTRVLLELSDGAIAVGTQEGLSLIRNGKVERSYGEADGMKTLSILCLLEDSDGTLYAGSDGDGIYAIKNNRITCYGFDQGLEEGVVLRILADSDGGGYFVSAGSSLYYWENDTFRKLSNLKKEAGSIFDFYLKNGTLWLLQNSGIVAVDRAALLDEKQADTVTYGFAYGLTGSLNANTWHYVDTDGSLYLATRGGISIFHFTGVKNRLPKIVLNDVRTDDGTFEQAENLSLLKGNKRITLDFAALSFTDTSRFVIRYCLDGFDEKETTLSDQKNAAISYTNLPGGDYTFRLAIYDPAFPEDKNTIQIPFHKNYKLFERPWFIFLFILSLALLSGGIVLLLLHIKLNAMRQRQREYQQIIDQSLQTFARIIDAKDAYTNGHSIRVACYSREIAKRMNMSKEEQERIYYVALLHDIGKIGVPDSILNKNGKLTDEERHAIQQHPVIGGDILKNFTTLDGVEEGARYHHERYDGKGYCEGKKGEEIPITARIISVADTYDAMSSNRCYRPALTTEKIVSELKNGSGSQLDPQIVPIMLKMISEGAVPIVLEKDDIRFTLKDGILENRS